MKIPLFKIAWDEEDIEAVGKVIRSGKYWCTGTEIEEFEKRIADFLGVNYCIVFNSGGSALHAVMNAHDIHSTDEVIIPSFTFIATAYSPLYVRALPVFVDVELDTFGLNPQSIINAITTNTKAIIPIHYGGMPCKIDEIKEIAESKNILLIEDAAESFGAKYKGEYVGTFGDSAIFSFCHNKVFTTSEGGCAVTNNVNLYEKMKLFRSYGRVVKGDYFAEVDFLDYIELGYNLRMSSILAALGISQLNRVKENIAKRRANAKYLNDHLACIDDIVIPTQPNNDFEAVYQMYTIRVLDGIEKREKLMQHLKEQQIASKVYFEPVHKYSVFRNSTKADLELPITKLLSEQALTLPMYPQLTMEEADYIIEAVQGFFET